MWTLTFEGHTIRTDDLSIGELERIERAAGVPLAQLNPYASAGHMRALVCGLLAHGKVSVKKAGRVRLADLSPTVDDLPVEFVDGVPDSGGWTTDRWLAQLCPPFTPRQIREEFTLRDVQLLAAANPKERDA